MMDDLFSYPIRAGFKEKGGTSEAAARAVDERLSDLHIMVMAVYHDSPAGLTADEAAAMIGEDRLTIRPRVTELGKIGKLAKTKARRKNDSGASAAVWRKV